VIYTSERVTRLEEKDCETLVEEKEEGNGDEGAEDQLTRWTTAWAPPLPGEPIDAEMPTPFYYSRDKLHLLLLFSTIQYKLPYR
jgi:hypothetical protein